MILVDYHAPTPLNDATVLGHLVFGISQASVDTTICGGRVLMAGRQLEIELDEAALAARSRGLAAALGSGSEEVWRIPTKPSGPGPRRNEAAH